MKRRTAGRMFAGVGLVFLLLNAIQYLTSTRTTRPFVTIGIALVVIGAAIVKSGKKDESSGTR